MSMVLGSPPGSARGCPHPTCPQTEEFGRGLKGEALGNPSPGLPAPTSAPVPPGYRPRLTCAAKQELSRKPVRVPQVQPPGFSL